MQKGRNRRSLGKLPGERMEAERGLRTGTGERVAAAILTGSRWAPFARELRVKLEKEDKTKIYERTVSVPRPHEPRRHQLGILTTC